MSGKILIIKILKRFEVSLVPVTVTHGLEFDGYQHEVHLHEAEPGKEDEQP